MYLFIYLFIYSYLVYGQKYLRHNSSRSCKVTNPSELLSKMLLYPLISVLVGSYLASIGL